MKKPPFAQIWNHIVSLAGKAFRTKTGLPFTYEVRGRTVRPSRTEYQIAEADFARAYQLVPVVGPGAINKIVRGPAYVWAILHDTRISNGAW